MRKVVHVKKSKKAITLVELVVSMALTAVFAAACVILIYPVSRTYTHMNDLARAQLIADTVIESLRNECSGNYISSRGDVWIANRGDIEMTSADIVTSADGGPVLVLRRSANYCETIFANYPITGTEDGTIYYSVLYNDKSNDSNYTPQTGGEDMLYTRSIYGMFPEGVDPSTIRDVEAGYVHFGYYVAGVDSTDSSTPYVLPMTYYDFTNPFISAVYGDSRRDYRVNLTFRDIHYLGDRPAYVLCDVTIIDNDTGNIIYTRTVALSFS